MAVRIVIADDHPVVRAGIQSLLARYADIEPVGEARDGDEAVQQTEALQPDVLLLDLSMPGLPATEVIQRVQALPQPAGVLILTAYGDADRVCTALGAGATGYLLKGEPPGVIADAVRAVAEGKTWLSDEVMQTLAQHVVEDAQHPAHDKLSTRELEVLRLVAAGKTNQEIGATLYITEKAVEKRLGCIYLKLNVAARAEAVAAAMQQGLL